MTKKFPILFKKNSNHSIQYWEISVEHKLSNSIIRTEYGQLNTLNPQETHDLINFGKNIGKSNETTYMQQAELEALYRWEKKKKRGYVEKIDDATSGKVDTLIAGGIDPMLAHSYDKQGHKIIFPCYVQPKLDGHRCIAIIQNGKCSLWSRTRKPITSVPHINKELLTKLSENASNPNWIIDGELYSSKFKNDFESISHIVRQQEPDPNHTDIEYHIYDCVLTNDEFSYRWRILENNLGNSNKYCKLVDTRYILQESDIKIWFDNYIKQGYEGLMLRNCKGGYENKRSYNLQKLKKFEDAEFKVVGIIEGKGKLHGHVGSFTCYDPVSDKTFDVKMSGNIDKLKEYFTNDKLWYGKMLTVQFQGRTGKKGVPRFPIGLRFRENI